jgi:hypothetical protein
MINMTIRELYCTFADLFQIGIFAGFSLCNINFAGRNSDAAIKRGGLYFFGCNVAQFGPSVAQ